MPAIRSRSPGEAAYWIDTITELRSRLVAKGRLMQQLIDRFFAHCAEPHRWTPTIAFTAIHARAPETR